MNQNKLLRALDRRGDSPDATTVEVLAKIPDEGVIQLLSQLVRNNHVTQEQAQPVFDAFIAYYTPEAV